MTKLIGGMEKVKLTEGLLDLIIMVQEYNQFLRSKNMFNKAHGLEEIDVYNGTKDFYNNIDENILSKYKLSTNLISFEKVLSYKVTDEMENIEYSDLSNRFTF